MNGVGILRLASGTKFKGKFKKGIKHGECIEEDKQGNRFEGSYRNGIKDGPFTEKDKTGRITAKGKYENGKKITN